MFINILKIELYCKKSFKKKPVVGSELNKPAILTYNIDRKDFSDE